MVDRRRNAYATLGLVIVVMLLGSLSVSCRPVPIPIPIPVPQSSSGKPLVFLAIGTQAPPSETSTPQPSTGAEVPESSTEAAQDELVDTLVSAAMEDAPAPISHKFGGREDCLDCHQVGNGKNASPPDHQGFSDDFCLYCHSPEESDITVPPLPEDASSEFCLGCHGPYQDLMDRTVDSLIDENGVKANPHVYVPHDSATITSCKYCHGVHALPVDPSEEIPQAKETYCFAACHHEENYEPCLECHE